MSISVHFQGPLPPQKLYKYDSKKRIEKTFYHFIPFFYKGKK